MLERIGDVPTPCTHPEHNPPTMIVLPAGVYRHTCPGCGNAIEFVVVAPSWSSGGMIDTSGGYVTWNGIGAPK